METGHNQRRNKSPSKHNTIISILNFLFIFLFFGLFYIYIYLCTDTIQIKSQVHLERIGRPSHTVQFRRGRQRRCYYLLFFFFNRYTHISIEYTFYWIPLVNKFQYKIYGSLSFFSSVIIMVIEMTVTVYRSTAFWTNN